MANVDIDSPSVQTSVTLLQGIISRMASNSASSKAWCITLISAIVVVVADKAQVCPDYVFVALIPALLFFLLDCFYLGVERELIKSYNVLITKLQDGSATPKDLFTVALGLGVWNTIRSMAKGMWSFSTSPFYLLMAATIVIVRELILS